MGPNINSDDDDNPKPVAAMAKAPFRKATGTSTSFRIVRSRNPPPNLGLSNHTTTHYFTYLLYAGFLTLAIPFRPVLDRKTKEYVIGSNYFQATLCYAVWVFSLVFRFTVIRETWSLAHDTTSNSETTIRYFNLAHATIHALVYGFFFRIFHCQREQIIELLNEITKSPVFTITTPNQLSCTSSLLKLLSFTRLYLLLTQIAYAVLTIASPIIGYDLTCTGNWSWSELINAYVAHGRYTLFLSGRTGNTSDSSTDTLELGNNSTSNALFTKDGSDNLRGEVWSLTVADKLIGSFQALVIVSKFILLFFTVTVFGNCTVTLWAGASAFKNIVANLDETQGPLQDIPADYDNSTIIDFSFRSLSSISNKVNKIWHMMAFVYVLDAIAWLSTGLDTGLRTDDWFVKLSMFYFLAYMGAAFLFSGETFRKIDWTRQALIRRTGSGNYCSSQDQQSHANPDIHDANGRFAYIIRTMRHLTIGLGNTGFYRINYSFIAKITVLIITFFVISVQHWETNRTEGTGTKMTRSLDVFSRVV